MSKLHGPRLTDRELDIMAVLWDLGAASVAEVRDRLPDELAYTTVLTILRNLESKGHLRHDTVGRAHLFSPTVVRRDVARAAIQQIVDKIFHGSPELLVNRVLTDYGLAPEKLRRIHDEVDRQIRAGPPASPPVSRPPPSPDPIQ